MSLRSAKRIALFLVFAGVFASNAPAQVDSTGVAALTGAVTLNSSVTPNQGGSTRAWTYYFLGQTKSSGTSWGVTIQSDGSVYFHGGNNSVVGSKGVPLGNSEVVQTQGNPCWGGGNYDIAYPVFTDSEKLNGMPPSSWAVRYGSYASQSCSSW